MRATCLVHRIFSDFFCVTRHVVRCVVIVARRKLECWEARGPFMPYRNYRSVHGVKQFLSAVELFMSFGLLSDPFRFVRNFSLCSQIADFRNPEILLYITFLFYFRSSSWSESYVFPFCNFLSYSMFPPSFLDLNCLTVFFFLHIYKVLHLF